MTKWYWEKQLELTDFGAPIGPSNPWSILQDNGYFYSIDQYYGVLGDGVTVYTKDLVVPYQNYKPSGFTTVASRIFGRPGSYTGNFYTAWNDTTPGQQKSYLYVTSLNGTVLGTINLGVYNTYPISAIIEISPSYIVIIRSGTYPLTDFKAEVRAIPSGTSLTPFAAGTTFSDNTIVFPLHIKNYMSEMYFQSRDRTYFCTSAGSISDVGLSTINVGSVINETFNTTHTYSWYASSVLSGYNEWGYDQNQQYIKTVNDSISIPVGVIDYRIVVDGYDIYNQFMGFALNFTSDAPDLFDDVGEFMSYSGSTYTIMNPIRDWDTSRCELFANIGLYLGNLAIKRCWKVGSDLYAISRDWSKDSNDSILWKLKWSIGTASVGKHFTNGYKHKGKYGT